MKKIFFLLIALALTLVGCASKGKTEVEHHPRKYLCRHYKGDPFVEPRLVYLGL